MVPDDLKYTENHEWARAEADGSITVGITFHAQEQLGDVVFVQPPEPGRAVKRGEACATIESVKAASDIHAPIAGTIITVNESLSTTPELVNQDAYAAWMFRIEPSVPAELETLLDPAAYREIAASGPA